MNKIEKLQKELDEQKWLESEKQGHDMSGCMPYCEKCEYADHSHPTENGKCYAESNRAEDCLCANAWLAITMKKLKRSGKHDKRRA